MRHFVIAIALSLFAAPAVAQDTATERVSAVADDAIAICMSVVFDGQSFDAAVEGKPWASVDPRSTGSNLATHAWEARSLSGAYLMRLGNGGCSFGIQDGDGAIIRMRMLERLNARAAFETVMQEETRGGRATRYAYCVREQYPRVVSMVVGESQPRFVFNLFRASDSAPSFCQPQA